MLVLTQSCEMYRGSGGLLCDNQMIQEVIVKSPDHISSSLPIAQPYTYERAYTHRENDADKWNNVQWHRDLNTCFEVDINFIRANGP